MVFQHQNYRDFLKTTLTERTSSTDGLSLRAFSQKLGVSNSFLSEVLNAHKSLSVALAFKIAVKLGLTERETQYLCLLVQLEQEADPAFKDVLLQRIAALNPVRPTHDLSVDAFRTIADWHHFAILESTYLTGYRLEAHTIAPILGISPVEAQQAIDRLVRLELLERDARGRYRKTHARVLSSSSVPDAAFRQHHRQLLQRAMRSLEERDSKERVSSSDLLPLDSRRLPEVARLAEEFTAAVIRISEKSAVKDAIYGLSVQCFPVTPRRSKKKEHP